jgi:hypothetical protein
MRFTRAMRQNIDGVVRGDRWQATGVIVIGR